MQINREAVLRFYDTTDFANDLTDLIEGETLGGHASALTGILGEDLVLGLLAHFLESREPNAGRAVVKSYRCISAEVDSKRKLDAWLVQYDLSGRPKELFQVEVKNWCRHSYRMPQIDVLPDAGNNELMTLARANWTACVDAKTNDRQRVQLSKVLEEMKLPKISGLENLSPPTKVLCFWAPLVPSNIDALDPPYSEVDCLLDDGRGHYLNGAMVFSGSLYLRSLNDNPDIAMPRVERRQQISDMFFVH